MLERQGRGRAGGVRERRAHRLKLRRDFFRRVPIVAIVARRRALSRVVRRLYSVAELARDRDAHPSEQPADVVLVLLRGDVPDGRLGRAEPSRGEKPAEPRELVEERVRALVEGEAVISPDARARRAAGDSRVGGARRGVPAELPRHHAAELPAQSEERGGVGVGGGGGGGGGGRRGGRRGRLVVRDERRRVFRRGRGRRLRRLLLALGLGSVSGFRRRRRKSRSTFFDGGAFDSSAHGDGEPERDAEGHGVPLGEVREVLHALPARAPERVDDLRRGLAVAAAADVRAGRADERVEGRRGARGGGSAARRGGGGGARRERRGRDAKRPRARKKRAGSAEGAGGRAGARRGRGDGGARERRDASRVAARRRRGDDARRGRGQRATHGEVGGGDLEGDETPAHGTGRIFSARPTRRESAV